MIVSYSTVLDEGAGFRSRLMNKRWDVLVLRLRDITFDQIPALRARVVIGHVERKQKICGIEGPSFVVENRIPIKEFKELNIREKNDFVLGVILDSVRAAYEHFGLIVPPEVESVRMEIMKMDGK